MHPNLFMTIHYFNLNAAHPSWHHCLKQALQQMDTHYLEKLQTTQNWLPGPQQIFNAFSIPVSQVNYLLLGESPYPRAASANGYAFWDAAVKNLWSPQGMDKKVNRATSLRNFIKMLLVAAEQLSPPHLSQEDIIKINKTDLVQTNETLFNNFLTQGFLLLNASLVLHNQQVKKDATAWRPFLKYIVHFLIQHRPQTKLILLGKIAHIIEPLLPKIPLEKLCAEHPYNHSFITNPKVLDFFKSIHLLSQNPKDKISDL